MAAREPLYDCFLFVQSATSNPLDSGNHHVPWLHVDIQLIRVAPAVHFWGGFCGEWIRRISCNTPDGTVTHLSCATLVPGILANFPSSTGHECRWCHGSSGCAVGRHFALVLSPSKPLCGASTTVMSVIGRLQTACDHVGGHFRQHQSRVAPSSQPKTRHSCNISRKRVAPQWAVQLILLVR